MHCRVRLVCLTLSLLALGATVGIAQDKPIEYGCIIVAVGSQPYDLTSEADGVWFDINGDGIPDHIAWTKPDEEVAFLGYDKNGNGVIDDGTELFGNATYPGSPNGFAALTKIANVQAGLLTAKNSSLFAKLLLWTDRNHDGVSEPDELRPLSQLFDAVGMGYGRPNRRDENGNLWLWGGFILTKGVKPLDDYGSADYREHQRDIYDVRFAAKK